MYDPRDYIVDLKVTVPIELDVSTVRRLLAVEGETARAEAILSEMTGQAWCHKDLRAQIVRGVLKSLEDGELPTWVLRVEEKKASFRVMDYSVPDFGDLKAGFIDEAEQSIAYTAAFIVTVRVMFDTPPSKDDFKPEVFAKKLGRKPEEEEKGAC